MGKAQLLVTPSVGLRAGAVGCLPKRLVVLLQGGLDLIGIARVPVGYAIVGKY